MFFADQQQQRMAREMRRRPPRPHGRERRPRRRKANGPGDGRRQAADQNAMEAKPKPAEPPVEQRLFRAEAMARFNAQLKAQAGFVERLVAFCPITSRCRGQGTVSARDRRSLEREAIRRMCSANSRNC